MHKQLLMCSLIFFFFVMPCTSASSSTERFQTFTTTELFDPSQAETLGLKKPQGLSSHVIYQAKKSISQYNHGAVLMPFKGRLYAQWQSSQQDEDAEDTVVRYSTSKEGKHWSSAKILARPRENAIVTNGGWWTDGNTLVAYLNIWPKTLKPRGGYSEYMTSSDGIHWSKPKRVLLLSGEYLNGIIEQDIKSTASGRLLTATHRQPGLRAQPLYSDDPSGIRGWQLGRMNNLAYEGDVTREIEPSWFHRAGGDCVMVFRDQASSFRVLASLSKNCGETWTQAEITNMPDSRSKQSAGNLSDGSAFLVNNPTGHKTRFPLALSTSADGKTFDQAWLIGSGHDLPKQRFAGRYKRAGFSYPKSIVWRGALWVAYAVNKEDIAVSRIPESAILREPSTKNYESH